MRSLLIVGTDLYICHQPCEGLDLLIFLPLNFSIFIVVLYFEKHKNHLTAITMPSTIFTQGFATLCLLAEMHHSNILYVALKDYQHYKKDYLTVCHINCYLPSLLMTLLHLIKMMTSCPTTILDPSLTV